MKPSSRIWRETLKLAEACIKPRDWPAELRATTDGATVESIGFYKKPEFERKQNAKGHNNGQWKIIGYKPVAVTIAAGELKIFIGNDDVPPRGEADLDFLSHPISEEEYREVAEQGLPFREFRAGLAAAAAFPDPELEAANEQAFIGVDMAKPGSDQTAYGVKDGETYRPATANEIGTMFENGNPDVVMEPKSVVYANRTVRTEEDVAQIRAGEAEKIKRRLAALKTEAPKFAKIESDEQSSAGRGLQARFLELRGEAAGHYEQANRPLLEQQKKLREIWFPIRDEADACKTEIGNALGGWEDTKRIAAKRAQEKADREARDHAEATRLAEEANQPPPPPPPLEKPNLPPPSAQIKAPGVRAAKVKLQRIVTEIDVEKAFAQFKAASEVREVLMSLAQRAVTAGLPVDGATIEERSKVS